MSVQELVKQNLLGLDREQLEAFFLSIGEKPFRARQVLQWCHTRGITDFDQMTDLSKSLREALNTFSEIKPLETLSESQSTDGTIKWLFALPEGGAVETVWIPEKERATLCISSQVGCSLNCKFCYTATQGFQRDLSSHEIISQLFTVFHTLKARNVLVDGVRPVTNIVMMGMGEPLMNIPNVFPSMKLMLDDLAYGLSKWRVTISTSGVVPGIDALGGLDIGLALSIHAPNDAIRSQIVPLNKKYPLKEVLAACQRYCDRDKRRKVTMEYVMLDGVNDQPEHARELARLLSHVPCKVNLIPFNPFPGTKYVCSSLKTMETFQTILKNSGFVATIRKTRGQDTMAACGQLAGEVKDRTKRQSRWKSSMENQAIKQVLEVKQQTTI